MGEWTAIILAGQRLGEHAFAAAHGVPLKALIHVRGEPMLGRVIRTLLASPSVGRLVVLAQRPDLLFAGELGHLTAEPRLSTVSVDAGISKSIAAIAGTSTAPWPLLVTTADHPLLRPEMIEDFLARSGGVDGAFAVVERSLVERVHPDTQRTWLKFADGHFSGANLFALVTPATYRGLEFWARVESHRKRAIRLLTFLGPAILLGAMTRTLSLDRAAERAGRSVGMALRAVKLSYPEAAIDVDKPADLELAERILANR